MLKKTRPRFLMVAFSMLSALVLLLSACGGTPTPTGNGSGQAVRGGTWIDDYYEEQFTALIKNHGMPLEVGLSNRPIPIRLLPLTERRRRRTNGWSCSAARWIDGPSTCPTRVCKKDAQTPAQ